MKEQRIKRLKRQLQESRYRLYKMNDEFAEPLYDMLFVATKDVWRISTNGEAIFFNPDWLQKLGNIELDFILSHQLMHIALGHIDRPSYYRGDRFHLACDIVANSHLELLGWKYDWLRGIGNIRYETIFPAQEGRFLTSQEALKCIPFDPALMKASVKRNYNIDSEEYWERKNDRGESGTIVLSPADEEPEDLVFDEETVGGNHFFVEREIFYKEYPKTGAEEDGEEGESKPQKNWEKNAAQDIMNLRSNVQVDRMNGNDAEFSERIWQQIRSEKVDWRKLLNSFVQEEICDYSFAPPDRRFQEFDFFLPDYNATIEQEKEVWFMVDVSGSIEDETLAIIYGEICNALFQFGGKLIGVLAFFDIGVYKPTRFSGVEDLAMLRPHGGAGTDFQCIFDYLKTHAQNNPPATIVILTDGQAEFPKESEAMNIPVLWLISNESITPPWGRVARII